MTRSQRILHKSSGTLGSPSCLMGAAAQKKWYQNKETETEQKQFFALLTNLKKTMCQVRMK